MTPQLQQVIKLLQLPTIELIDHVRQELETNPTLEEGQEPEITTEQADAPAPADAAEETMDNWLKLAADEEPREARNRDREEEMEERQEARMVPTRTLQDHLMDQLHITEASPADLKLAEFLIGNLDSNGYLTTPMAELEAGSGATPAALEAALALVQTLDPAGVGARDLKECLLLQLEEEPAASLARRIVEHHLAGLESSNGASAAHLARALGEPPAAIAAALKRIRACDPKLGGRFAPAPPSIYPDGKVEKMEGEYVVTLNDGGVPPLRLSRAYRELLANRHALGEEERRFLQDRFRSAQMLMRGIEQRRVTLHRVLEHIVKSQRDFLDLGVAHLKPLTLREVADAVGVHESTVSRVVANKYIHTPRGTTALRDFFSNRLPTAGVTGRSGAGTSAVAVRERIKDLIEAEPPGAPLSDDGLAEALNREGVTIARRTVTKYREGMHIPAATQRRGGWQSQNGRRASI